MSLQLKEVYVSSHRRGFMAITGYPSIIDKLQGGSGSGFEITRVKRENGEWVSCGQPSIWTSAAWKGAIAVQSSAPWRVYPIDAAVAAAHLDAGVHIDDVRGFASSRLEDWQPIRPLRVNEAPAAKSTWDLPDGYTFSAPSEATMWIRTDGWRIVQSDSYWVTDHTVVRACPSTIEYSPDHFNPLLGRSEKPRQFLDAPKAMEFVDRWRPWE